MLEQKRKEEEAEARKRADSAKLERERLESETEAKALAPAGKAEEALSHALLDQLASVQQERDQLQCSNNELHKLCEQLRDDLHRAAEAISNLKVNAADQEEKRLRWEEDARRVEEEESNLLAATKLDMDMQMTNLRDSMQAQIDALEAELIEERESSMNQQRELQRRIEEATTRLSSSESEMMAMSSKKEAKAMKQLQAAEKAAAKAVVLLDKKDEEVQQLQKVIADCEAYSIVLYFPPLIFIVLLHSWMHSFLHLANPKKCARR